MKSRCSRFAPLSLYIHIPFCPHKCPYCDFNSIADPNPDWDAYFSALHQELIQWSDRPWIQGRRLESIYFGGGTPSLAPTSGIAHLLEEAEKRFSFAPHVEISLEANPGASDMARFKQLKAIGVNRLSIGVQSFDDADLRLLGRIHSAKDAASAVEAAIQAGFTNINIDLMYGTPRQNWHAWRRQLERATRLEIAHLSCYQLTIEQGTHFAKRPPSFLPDEETSLRLFRQTQRFLADRGFLPYEVSNFAQKGMACRHNLGYWQYHDYIGIGAGACGKFDLEDGGVIRYTNVRQPALYIQAVRKGKAFQETEKRTWLQAAAEAFWLGLRMKEGIDRGWFQKRFKIDAWEHFSASLSPWLASGFIEVGSRIRATEQGEAVLDSLGAALLQHPEVEEAPSFAAEGNLWSWSEDA